MNSFTRYFTFTLMLLLGGVGSVQGFPEIEQIEFRSEWWPTHVRLVEAVPIEHESRHELKAGTKGVLLRVEGGKVLVDFGRYGVQALALDQTDFVEQYEQLSSKGGWDDRMVLNAHLFTKYFKLKEINFHVIEDKSVFTWDYMAFVHCSPGEQASDSLIERLEAFSPQTEEAVIHPVLLPSERDYMTLLAYFKDNEVSLPTLIPPVNMPYRELYDFSQQDLAMVIVDRNGRILREYDAAALQDIESLNASVAALVNEDLSKHLYDDRENLSH